MTTVIGAPHTRHYDRAMESTGSVLPLVHQSIGDIVARDSRAAAVLTRYGLDFCCGGHRTLADAALDKNAPLADIVAAIDALDACAADVKPQWPDIDALTRHIVDHHHHYVRQSTPTIQQWLDKLSTRHGDRHPELVAMRETFARLADELSVHMLKEETVLFPYIEQLSAAARTGTRLPPGPFGTIVNPVRVMEKDHRETGDLLHQLHQLSSGYTPPEDGCTTYRVCFEELARFEADLIAHIHLENHVLFPKAVDLEERLL